MATDSEELDNWRIFFRNASTNIFDVIEKAIMVAAKDCPLDLKYRREQIVHLLYCQCFPCKQHEQSMPQEQKLYGSRRMEPEDHVFPCVKEENRTIEHNGETNIADPITDEQAEASKDLVSEGGDMVEAILMIKEAINNNENQSDMVLMDLLTKLQRIDLSVEILRATMIGKTVGALLKHHMKEIRKVARSLIRAWRRVADDWVEGQAAGTDGGNGLPAIPSHPGTEAVPAFRSSSTELLEMLKDVDQEEFFSILPSGSVDRSFYFPEECDNAVEEQPPVICTRNGINKGERSPLPLLGAQDAVDNNDNNHLPIDTIELVAKDRENELATNLRNPSPSLKTQNTISRCVERRGREESSCMERRWREENSHVERRRREESSTMKLNTTSSTQLRFRAPPMDNNGGQHGQTPQETNGSRQPPNREQDKLEETRRKLREGYQKANDAKKQHSIQIVDVKTLDATQQNKRRKNQHHASSTRYFRP